MSQTLAGRNAVVIGASSGMGRAIVVALARDGANVLAAARRKDRLLSLKAELAAAGREIDICPTDAGDLSQVEVLFQSAAARFERLDLVVYASGTNIRERALDELSVDDWEMLLATNLTGAFLCTRCAVPLMRAAGGGLIVYLSTGAVQMPDVSGVAYQASKHGLSGLAHGTRVEEQANGIRTSVIFPGLCDTEILAKRPRPTSREVLERALRPEDVAEAVLFLARLDPRAVVPEMQLFPSRL